jgi:hypothetical protein
MKLSAFKKEIFWIIVNFTEIILVLLLYEYFYNSITPKELTAFGSTIQWAASISYLIFIFSIVAILVQGVIFALKIVSVVLKLDQAN